MYYRLKEPYAFRGWQRLPYAICAEEGPLMLEKPEYFDKELFLGLLYCNGREASDPETMPPRLRKVIGLLLERGMLEASEMQMPPLQPWQQYRVYPSRHLESVHWAITGKCNFRCRHCLVSAPDARHPQLSFEDCLRIMDQLEQCGIHQVDITGGEPLVRTDCEAFFRELTKRRICIRTVFTNASLLSGEVLDALERCGQRPAFQMSFDGLGRHDWLRGIPGAEKQADAAFRLLRERNLISAAAMCIHKANAESLRGTVKYLAEAGVHSLRVNAPQELGTWKAFSAQYALSDRELWQIFREYIPVYFEDGMPLRLELDSFFACDGGSTDYTVPFVHHVRQAADYGRCYFCETVRHSAHIDPEGRLVPCMGFCATALADRFPSLLDRPLGELSTDSFYEEIASTRMEDLMAADPECAACPHLHRCGGGCMMDGLSASGVHPSRSPIACFFHKHVGEAAVRSTADAAIAAFCRR